MSAEDDPSEVYAILSEPWSEPEDEMMEDFSEDDNSMSNDNSITIGDISQVRGYLGEEDISPTTALYPRSTEQANPQSQRNAQQLLFSDNLRYQMPFNSKTSSAGLWTECTDQMSPSIQRFPNEKGLWKSYRRDWEGTFQDLIQTARKLAEDKIEQQGRMTSLQARLEDVTVESKKLLARREADQKKICQLLVSLRNSQKTSRISSDGSSNCDLEVAQPFVADQNGFDWYGEVKDSLEQLCQDPTGKTVNPRMQHLSGLIDSHIQIVSLGFEWPEGASIRLTNDQNTETVKYKGCLIDFHALEHMSTNLQILRQTLPTMKTAFLVNEALLHKERRLRSEAEQELVDLRRKVRELDEQTEEGRLERLRQNLEGQLKQLIVEEEMKEVHDAACSTNVDATDNELELEMLGEALKIAQCNLAAARQEGEYYDPTDPTQEKTKELIRELVGEVKQLQGAIADLKGAKCEQEFLAPVPTSLTAPRVPHLERYLSP